MGRDINGQAVDGSFGRADFSVGLEDTADLLADFEQALG